MIELYTVTIAHIHTYSISEETLLAQLISLVHLLSETLDTWLSGYWAPQIEVKRRPTSIRRPTGAPHGLFHRIAWQLTIW